MSWKQGLGIKAIALSPDGNFLALAALDDTTRIIDVAHRRQVSLLSHTDDILALTFSPDSSYIALATEVHTVEIWDAGTGLQIACLNHGGKIYALTFSPDGKYLATASEDHYAYVTGLHYYSGNSTNAPISYA